MKENFLMHSESRKILEKLTEAINNEYGFHDGIPRINYGPCGVFAKIFFHKWNELFKSKVHICFVMTKDRKECDHIVIRLPSGDLYDGGVGVHTDSRYVNQFIIDEMINYDEALLEKWAYGLDRTYPRFCPRFNREFVEKIVYSNLEELYERAENKI
jgi:hypothetical protein